MTTTTPTTFTTTSSPQCILIRLVLFALLFFATPTCAQHSTIYIIRHGEKKWALGCLSAKGQQRANRLASVFNSIPSPNHALFNTPDHIFANYYDDPIDCERCIQTVTPIAKKLNITVNSTYGFPTKLGGNQLAAQTWRTLITSNNKKKTTILVAWEHVNIKPLTEALGVQSSLLPTWSGSDYDTVYVLLFNNTGHVINFTIAAENLTTTQKYIE